MRRALEYVEDAKKNHVKKPDEFAKPVNECCLKGKFLSDINETQQAYAEFGFVLDKLVKGDSYSMIGAANINYELSTRYRDNLQ